MEAKLKKKIGKAIPNELIYNIVDDLEDVRKMKRMKDKEKALKEILEELEEIASIADDAYKDTKSEAKKQKIMIFKDYNNDRLKIYKHYISTGEILKSDFNLCPDNKIINPKTGRCIKDKSLQEPKLPAPKKPRAPKKPKEPKEPIDVNYISYLKNEYKNKKDLTQAQLKFLADIIARLPNKYIKEIMENT